MAEYGGFEMVMAAGGMLRAAERNMIILVDGFIMTNCILAASRLHPEVLDYAVFGHQVMNPATNWYLTGCRPVLC